MPTEIMKTANPKYVVVNDGFYRIATSIFAGSEMRKIRISISKEERNSLVSQGLSDTNAGMVDIYYKEGANKEPDIGYIDIAGPYLNNVVFLTRQLAYILKALEYKEAEIIYT